MAFSQKEQEILKWGVQNGKSKQEIQDAVVRFRTTGSPADPSKQSVAVKSTEPGPIERVASKIQDAGQRVSEAVEGTGPYQDRSTVGRAVGATAEAFGAIPQVAAEVLPSPLRQGLGKVGEAFGNVINFVGEKIGNIPAVQKWVAEHPEAASSLEEVAKTAVSAGQISGTILGAKATASGAQKVVDVSKAGVQKAGEVISQAVDTARPLTKALYERSAEIIKPSPTPQKALGEVLQAKKPLSVREVEAFKNIDTIGIKTFSELESRIKESIGRLSGQVDEHLSQDKTPVPLQDLVTKTTSGSGRVVERNFVQTALEHLKELYQKSADDVGLADIDDVLAKAQATGLTRLEVNDISRLYNTEFGSKAFSKTTGEPITSVNAQAYENIRSGLKEVARKGLGGSEAAAADKIISSLYNTRDLVSKNVAAVQRLQQKIAERGLLEKVGNAVAKYGDMLTGGSLRGLIGGLLPRGAGYKILNALDLEERLAKNLEVIRTALESGSDEAIIKVVSQLDSVPSPK